MQSCNALLTSCVRDLKNHARGKMTILRSSVIEYVALLGVCPTIHSLLSTIVSIVEEVFDLHQDHTVSNFHVLPFIGYLCFHGVLVDRSMHRSCYFPITATHIHLVMRGVQELALCDVTPPLHVLPLRFHSVNIYSTLSDSMWLQSCRPYVHMT